MTLTKTQAQAVYNAMCALKSIGGTIRASIPDHVNPDHLVFVEECQDTGVITVTRGLRHLACYSNHASFAADYSL